MGSENLIVSVSGVRGVIGADDGLSPRTGCRFGQAFGTMLGSGKKVVTARDTRPSGQMIRSSVASGLMAAGVDVVDLGIVTTPGAAFMARLLKADGGVVITASHNPQQYNGIKFLQSSGAGLPAGQATELKELWESGKYFQANPTAVGRESAESRTHGNHIDAVCKTIDLLGISSRRFKVVLDSINGAGCVVTPMLLGQLGCEVAHINGEPTGLFAHEPEPAEKNLTQLCQTVLKHKAHVGFAQDPDADRLAVVDEKGRYIGEECTLALCAAWVLSRRKGKLATNLSTSRMIDDIAAAAGCQVLRAPTGEANVVELMTREGCIFGGEGNGGVIEPRVVPVRNSLVGIAYILQHMAQTGKKLSELADALPKYHLVKGKLPCPQDSAGKVIRAIRDSYAGRSDAKIDERDGLRIDLSDCWFNVRASNTEPIIRIFAEAKEPARADEIVKSLTDMAEKNIG
ncbi:MAG: phosphoglucosamine mutase [Planctomycetes bacterium]|nr:phosphoglucosamine mutase [Planctomycetota bacterium]